MQKMPIIFIGHGSPMNAVETNIYTESWKKIGQSLPRPKAIVVLSAHWITEGKTLISGVEHPEMIYDMYGFPEELYTLSYMPDGSPELAKEIKNLLTQNTQIHAEIDSHGMDHGIWSTLIHMFPDADIPIVSMSLDYLSSADDLYAIGEALSPLRESGVLIIGTGNIVHNLRAMNQSEKYIHPWAVDFNQRVIDIVTSGKAEYKKIFRFPYWGDISKLAHPTYDHLLPLIPLMGLAGVSDTVSLHTPDIVMGSISMLSIVWSE